MQRRDFSLALLGVSVSAASLWRCAPPFGKSPSSAHLSGGDQHRESPPRLAPLPARDSPEPELARGDPQPIRAICFDLFTLFDPRSIVRVAERLVPGGGAELCDTWRVRQFEYAWLRAAAGRYASFRDVTRDALDHALRVRKLSLAASARETLVSAYSELDLWPDTRAMLDAWRAAGLRLAPLANYSPDMLEPLLAHAGITDHFAALISTDAARSFKPDPRAYALGVSALGLAREQIAFAAFGGWDAAGARWFGYPTFWVNRLGLPHEALDTAYDATGPGLAELAQFVSGWARS